MPAARGGRRVKIAPATGVELAVVAESTAEDVDAAVESARKAQRIWAEMSVLERKEGMLAWAHNLRGVAEELVAVDAADSGTPLHDMRKGVMNGITHLEHFAGLGFELVGQTIPATPGNLHYTLREPYGIIGILTPFNGPSFFPIKLSAPALAAGNAVILKPSEQTPLGATIIANAAAGALPDGLVNVVQGGPEAGQAIVVHPRIERLHLTGGVPTGLAIQKAAAESGYVKEISLELGGKNPLIVFPDVDVETVSRAAIKGMNFTHQGQSCGSTSRLFVHRSLAKEVTERVTQLVSEITVALPDDPEAEMGSLVSQRHKTRVLSMIEMAKEEGATLLAGGGEGEGPLADGAYVMPTVFGDVRPSMRIAQEEVFGPVLSIIEWEDEAEMLEAVNSVDYGLTASIFTNDLTKALTTASKVESGYVWINEVVHRWLGVPFGGYKNSGAGVEHAKETMLEYTREKSVSVVMNHGGTVS
ncbi:aldehyde dehydrogenase family protein [Aeromicrobium piscarium]|uniref:Aldehyde dehydrogenase family protein n=1 Tax=Aeromicrobium piscarium TaxID=2590901 RepID=A0A554RXD5_9ACTN|nr:aldehyde dehydrogenase family protein [Aeromicrobium piscarium]TSD58744.1 aldehyde dehydrogenase family protein [Aeromicrobium piscarium]